MLDRDLPLKKEISDNIKSLMKQRGWTQLRTSEKSGISKSTLSDYINCKTLINPGNVEKLSEAFGVPKFEIDPSFNNNTKTVNEGKVSYISTTTKKLPVVGKISCGPGVLAFEEIEGYEETPLDWLNGGEYFYLRAKGDSMVNARILDGDLLLIRRQDDVENGEIAAVAIGDEAVLKRVYKTNNNIILQSENPKYPPIVLDDKKNIRIIGKLKKVVLNF
ncbi:transcriptional repressor LexA [Heyndrickxia oleronia]|uniref:transcriptional repressor LexA n=1 Tax=Heyndrickxia oleronia TaxID=38875 RepID=UPI00203AE342|nr:transcriptional repressor LexA [Heyndrickxia oleronia]MCM3454442.1 transcriptional repressor LexA [Heyndrickxia oleronia]